MKKLNINKESMPRRSSVVTEYDSILEGTGIAFQITWHCIPMTEFQHTVIPTIPFQMVFVDESM